MRRIQSKKSLERKQKKNQLIIGIILIVVMFGSVFGIIVNSFNSEENSNILEYNGLKFVNSNGIWVLNLGNIEFLFKYNPEEVEKVDSELDALSSYSGEVLYIDSKNYEAKLEVYRNFNSIAERIQLACIEETDCEENLPIKTCDDRLIIIKEGEFANVLQEDKCVFINAPAENLTKTVDSFLFNILDIT